MSKTTRKITYAIIVALMATALIVMATVFHGL